jgi:hypothetical protein
MLAIIAIPTLIISIIALLQEKRIKELTEVVIELKNQTKELKVQSDIFLKRYELELLLSSKNRMPFFEPRDFYTTGPFTYNLFLSNSGLAATDVKIFNLNWEKLFVKDIIHISGGPDVRQGGEMVFTVQFTQSSLNKEYISFSFVLQFDDGRGNKFSQLVTCANGNVRAMFPQVIAN